MSNLGMYEEMADAQSVFMLPLMERSCGRWVSATNSKPRSLGTAEMRDSRLVMRCTLMRLWPQRSCRLRSFFRSLTGRSEVLSLKKN